MHKEVKKFYNQTGLEILESVQDQLETAFKKQTAKSSVGVTISQIYRIKRGGVKNKEYVWYTENHSSSDRKGNPCNILYTIGKYDMPIAQYKFDDQGDPEVTGVSGFKTVYEVEWSPKLVEEWEKKGMLNEDTQCYITNGQRKYGQFFMEQYTERDFEDLLVYGQTGKWPTKEEKEIMTGPPSKRMGANLEQKESK